MDQPLGAAVGNALEVREALATVRGHGPADFTELVLDACARLLALSDLGIDVAEGRARAEAAVADGSAEAVWNRWIEAQGGTADESALERAPVVREVIAPRAGTVAGLDAIRVGIAALHLGAGRRVKSDSDRPCGRRRLPAQARRPRRGRARCSPRSTRATTRPRTRRPARSLAAYDDRRRARPGQAGAARGHHLARYAARARAVATGRAAR